MRALVGILGLLLVASCGDNLCAQHSKHCPDAGGDADAASQVGDGRSDAPAPDAPCCDAWPDAFSGDAACGRHELPVSLGAAGDYAILAKAGISTVPASAITGDIGTSPIDSTAITGFSLVVDASNQFATSTQVVGRVYAPDYAPPTPSNLTTAVGDMETAFTDAAGRAPDVTELGAGDVGGMTLSAGVYAWSSGLLIPTDLALVGCASDVFVFQVAGDLEVASGVRVSLAGGVRADHVFWQVSGFVRLGTTSHLEGSVLTLTMANLLTGASIDGRLLAQTAVTLDAATVVLP